MCLSKAVARRAGSALRDVSLSADILRRLHFLGLHDTGSLQKWTKGQYASFLGAEWFPLRPYLHSPRTDRIAIHRPAPKVDVALAFGHLDPALHDLSERGPGRPKHGATRAAGVHRRGHHRGQRRPASNASPHSPCTISAPTPSLPGSTAHPRPRRPALPRPAGQVVGQRARSGGTG